MRGPAKDLYLRQDTRLWECALQVCGRARAHTRTHTQHTHQTLRARPPGPTASQELRSSSAGLEEVGGHGGKGVRKPPLMGPSHGGAGPWAPAGALQSREEARQTHISERQRKRQAPDAPQHQSEDVLSVSRGPVSQRSARLCHSDSQPGDDRRGFSPSQPHSCGYYGDCGLCLRVNKL